MQQLYLVSSETPEAQATVVAVVDMMTALAGSTSMFESVVLLVQRDFAAAPVARVEKYSEMLQALVSRQRQLTVVSVWC